MNPQNPSLQRLLAAQQSLPYLAYDIQNSTQPLALKGVVEKIFNLTADVIYLLLEVVSETSASSPAPTQVGTIPAVAVTSYRPPTGHEPPLQMPGPSAYSQVPNYQNPFTVPPMITQPMIFAPASAGMPEMPPCRPGELNVTITSAGTTVIPPTGGQPIVVPPHEPVDVNALMAPAVPPPAPPGVMNVVLPRGGVQAVVAQNSQPGGTSISPDSIIPPK